MVRYIDAEDLKKIINANSWSNPVVPQVVCTIIDRSPTADVAPKSEVDRLNAVMKEMDEQRAYTINMLGESLEKAKAEVEKIFAEIEEALIFSKCYGDSGVYFEHDIETDIAELKKKYVKGGEY